MRTGTIALTVLCAASLVAMAIVNRMPMGDRYTYTDESDLWYVDGGEMAIAAPEAVLLTLPPAPASNLGSGAAPTAAPSATPTATPSATPTATPTVTPTVPPAGTA